jgi:hypothetical protein
MFFFFVLNVCVLVVQFNGVEQKEVGDGQAPITTKLVLY